MLRIVFVGLGALCVLCLTPMCLPAGDNPFLPDGVDDAGWPSVRESLHDAHSREVGIVDHWPPAGPPVLWIKEIGQEFSAFVAKVTRVFTQPQTLAGQFVVCLDADSGETVWEHRDDLPSGSPIPLSHPARVITVSRYTTPPTSFVPFLREKRFMSDFEEMQYPEVRQLSYRQRRILGVLIEKGITTPEYYPMTIKAVTTACNQKNNRFPVVNFEDGLVEDQLEELQKMGLVGKIISESSRADRFRHFVRKRYPFTEPQLAIMTELWLRGQQSLGDLRARAARMKPIEDLAALRDALKGLLDAGFVQVNGPLEMRGVEVDHTFYQPAENQKPMAAFVDSEPNDIVSPRAPSSSSSSAASSSTVQAELTRMTERHDELRDQVVKLQTTVEGLTDRLDRLAKELGVS